MTYEEAIWEIKWVKENGFVADDGIFGTDKIKEAFDMAIEAMEKRVPKKLEECDDDRIALLFCPVCCSPHGRTYGKGKTTRICSGCGQIVWWDDRE